jgi:Skp family chaperone for outer membrane proteins
MRKTCLLAVFLAASAVAVRAQEAAPAATKAEPLRSARIAVVDMQRISSETLLGKGYAAQIDALTNEMTSERAKKQNDLQKIDDAIKALQDDLQKQASVLSPEATDKKQQEIVRKTRERQNFVEDGQVELQKMQERLQKQAQNLEGEFQGKIKPFVDAVAKEKGIDVLLNAQVVLGASKEFDLSSEVIVKADDAERAARAKAPAASTTGPKTPATTPAPAKP